MKSVIALALSLVALLMPTLAVAHPHLWVQQVVRAVAKDGKYTHVEIEWRFDPFSSEIEIPLRPPRSTGSAEGGLSMSTPPMAMIGPMASRGW